MRGFYGTADDDISGAFGKHLFWGSWLVDDQTKEEPVLRLAGRVKAPTKLRESLIIRRELLERELEPPQVYIDDTCRISEVIRPGRLVIVDH